MDAVLPIVPTKATLKRYGLTANEWIALAESQGNCCAICKRLPKSARLHTEHEHVKGWKKMPPDQRKSFVRGLACFLCNSRFLSRGMTAEKAYNMYLYLKTYTERTPQSAS